MQKSRRAKRRTDWGEEISKCLVLVGKLFLKVLSWVMNLLISVLLVGGITGIIVGGTFLIFVLNEVDVEEAVSAVEFMRVDSAMTTQIYYVEDDSAGVDGYTEIEDQRLSATENRLWVSYDEIPQVVKDAIVCVEDKRFWTHPGVDFLTTTKCALKYFTGQGMAGGSSLTQQVIKNVTGDDEVSIMRKVREIMASLTLEKRMTKEQILEIYLNTVYFGHRCNGIAAAAYTYFGKDVEDLTLLEAASIVGITQNPSKYDPYNHPENNLERRQVVLTCMRDQGKITNEEYLSVWGEELKLAGETDDETETTTSSNTGIFSWYTECVIDETLELLMEKYGYTKELAYTKLYTGGFKIVTAEDPEVQEILEDYYEHDENFEKVDDSAIQPESSFIIEDPKTGNVLGVVGGRGEKTANRILNYAKTTRPSGSSIKPLSVYAPALEYGLVNYATVTDDTPVNFGEEIVDPETGLISYSRPTGYPRNSNDVYNGLVTLHYALQRSINTVSYKTLMKLGLDRSFDFVKNKCHVDSLIESGEVNGYYFSDKAYAPLALGQQSYGVTNLEMTTAYSIFADDGVYHYARFVLEIYDNEWNLLIENEPKSEIVLSETTASLMNIMLQEVVESGTGKKITLKNQVSVAGKTGTTQSECDRWFIGYTPYYLAGVWFGYSIPQSLSSFEVNPVIATWDGVMTRIHEKLIQNSEETGVPLEHFEIADGIIQATYCKDSGKLATAACLCDPRGSRIETGYFTADNQPTESCDVHVLVNYDKTSGGIANPACPEEDVIQVGLLNIKRSFLCQVVITDAEYVYWDLTGTGFEPGGTENDPFFLLAIPENTYVGISGTDPKKQYNRACLVHTYVPETEPSTDTDTGTDTGTDISPGETEPIETQPLFDGA